MCREHTNKRRVLQAIRDLHTDLRDLVGGLQEGIMKLTTNQAKLDADVQALTEAQAATAAALTGVTTHLDNLAAEVQALKNANPALDFTALDNAVSGAQAGLAQAQALAQTAVTDDPDSPPTP